ncbi:hypothetical protein GCM10027159_06890 [Lysobacter terrae]
MLALICSTAQAAQVGLRRDRPLTCPKEVRSTGTLLIGLGPRHGSELAIVRKSDGARFVLVAKDKILDMPSPDFKKTVLFQYYVDAEVEATDGIRQKIFNAPGEFQVIVSDDVMADKGGHRCTFRFTE